MFFKRLQNTEMNGLEFKHYPLCKMDGKGNVHKWHFYLCNKQPLFKFCICEATLGKKTTTNHPINWFFKICWALKSDNFWPLALISSRHQNIKVNFFFSIFMQIGFFAITLNKDNHHLVTILCTIGADRFSVKNF